MLEKHPHHIRKKIAIFWTLAIAVVLVVVFVIVYIGKKEEPTEEAGSKIGEFYKTILNQTQSYFGGN